MVLIQNSMNCIMKARFTIDRYGTKDLEKSRNSGRSHLEAIVLLKFNWETEGSISYSLLFFNNESITTKIDFTHLKLSYDNHIHEKNDRNIYHHQREIHGLMTWILTKNEKRRMMSVFVSV